jgi:hypothetical protein
MKNSILGALVVVLLVSVAFRLGQNQPMPTDGNLHAQGRGPVIPPKPRTKPNTAPEPLVYGGEDGGAAVSNNGFMAVTGSYGVGTSVLYLMDTNNKQLLVYEARGGSQSMRRLVLVGARRIDLDLQLIDYNDESEYKRSDLARMFGGGAKRRRSTGVTVPGEIDKPLGTGEYRSTRRNAKSGKK